MAGREDGCSVPLVLDVFELLTRADSRGEGIEDILVDNGYGIVLSSNDHTKIFRRAKPGENKRYVRTLNLNHFTQEER